MEHAGETSPMAPPLNTKVFCTIDAEDQSGRDVSPATSIESEDDAPRPANEVEHNNPSASLPPSPAHSRYSHTSRASSTDLPVRPPATIEANVLYLIAYNIGHKCSRPYRKDPMVVTWALAYSLSNSTLTCFPHIGYNKYQRIWIESGRSWTWSRPAEDRNLLLIIKLGDVNAVPFDTFLGLLARPYASQVVHLADGRQYQYVRLIREKVIGMIRIMGGITNLSTDDDFLDDVRRFTHLVTAKSVIQLSLQAFL